MSETDKPMQATPPADLESQIMLSTVPKNEREWWAHHEIEKLRAHVRELETELETERMRLSACGVAALGYFTDCKDEYRSASLEDVLRLYAKAGELERLLDEVRTWDLNQCIAGMHAGNGIKLTLPLELRKRIQGALGPVRDEATTDAAPNKETTG